jgi:uncharacterized protein (TIRG00374 family)
LEEENRNGYPPGDGEKAPFLWGWHTLASLAITAAVLVPMVCYVDLSRVWREVSGSDKGLLFLAALSHYATYPVRGIRWRRSLRHVPVRCGDTRFGLIVFFYNFVDNLVPAKLGDVYGAHLAHINCGVRRSIALGSIVFLRAVDAWVVLILAATASWTLFSGVLPRTVTLALLFAFAIAAATTVVIAVFLFLQRSVPAWVPETMRQRIVAFQTGMLPGRGEFGAVALLTVAIWALESMWIFLLARSFQLHLSAAKTVFLTMIPVIATAFPFTPSGAVAVELTLFGCLRLVGAGSPLAVSLTVVNRFLDFWLHILLGAFLWVFRKNFGLRGWKDRPHPVGVGPPHLCVRVRKQDAP